jgi:hypothetical protein
MITETPTRTRWEDAIMAVELSSFLLCHPGHPVVTRLEDKCLRVADTKGTLMHAEVAVIFFIMDSRILGCTPPYHLFMLYASYPFANFFACP